MNWQIDPEELLRRSDDAPSASVDDELVILNLAADAYVSTNLVGRRIWELLEEPVSVGELCDRLAREFAAPTGTIRSDVLEFLNQLASEGLVHAVSS